MAYHVLQYPVLFGDPARPVGAGATVTVTSAVDDSAAECFSAREGGTAVSNVVPVVNGFFRTYVPAGRYNLAASYQGKTMQLLDVEVGEIQQEAGPPTGLIAAMNFESGTSHARASSSESGARLTVSPTGEAYAYAGSAASGFSKFYVEVEILAMQDTSSANLLLHAGFARSDSLDVDFPYPNYIMHQGGNYYANIDDSIVQRGTGYNASVGDILMIAIDFENDRVWFGVNGDWGSGSDPSTDTLPVFAPDASFPNKVIASGSLSGNWYFYAGGYADGTDYHVDLRVRSGENQAYTTPTGFNV